MSLPTFFKESAAPIPVTNVGINPILSTILVTKSKNFVAKVIPFLIKSSSIATEASSCALLVSCCKRPSILSRYLSSSFSADPKASSDDLRTASS